MEVRGQRQAQAALNPEKNFCSHWIGVTEMVCIFQKKFIAPGETELSYLCHPARSLVTILTELPIAVKTDIIPPNNSLLPSGYNSLCIMSGFCSRYLFRPTKPQTWP
jgi:hypothetical protein